MYVLMEYLLTKDNGPGDRTSKPVCVLDFSDTKYKFNHLIPSQDVFKRVGYCNVGRMYNKKHKILINTEHQNVGGAKVVMKMVREKQINDLLSI